MYCIVLYCKVAGLTYVALSRVRTLSDIVIEPLTFERLYALKKHLIINISRLLEESRLEQLAQHTFQKHVSEKNVTFFTHLLHWKWITTKVQKRKCSLGCHLLPPLQHLHPLQVSTLNKS